MNSLPGASDQGATVLDYLDHHVMVMAQRNAHGCRRFRSRAMATQCSSTCRKRRR